MTRDEKRFLVNLMTGQHHYPVSNKTVQRAAAHGLIKIRRRERSWQTNRNSFTLTDLGMKIAIRHSYHEPIKSEMRPWRGNQKRKKQFGRWDAYDQYVYVKEKS